MLNRIDELTRRLHADPENPMIVAQLKAERERVFGKTELGALPLAPGQVLEYVLAGKATLTLQSLRTGKHLTFKVKQQFDREVVKGKRVKVYRPVWDVLVMTGTNNENDADYEALGHISGRARTFRLGNGTRFERSDPPARAFHFMLHFARLKEAAPQLRVWHHGRCGRCARKLTVPESIRRGIGPECAGKTTQGKREVLKAAAEKGRKSFEEVFMAIKARAGRVA